ncbi:MAG: hypothetical protein ACR2NG_03940 [Acidimicrobiia bacterium]
MARHWLVAVLVLLLPATACSGDPADRSGTVNGAVVVVSGDVAVESFVVKHSDGSSLQFTPAVDAGVDLGELRGLVVSGDDVTVVYERADDNTLVAVSVERSG